MAISLSSMSSLKQRGTVSLISLNVPVDTAFRCHLSVIIGMTVVTTVMSKTVVGRTILLTYSTKAAGITES